MDTLKKSGVLITLIRSTAIRHTIGRKSLAPVIFFSLLILIVTSCDGFHDIALGQLVLIQLSYFFSVS